MIVDVEDYRKRREARLEDQRARGRQRVLETGNEEELEPMNPTSASSCTTPSSEIDGVETLEPGRRAGRYVVILPL